MKKVKGQVISQYDEFRKKEDEPTGIFITISDVKILEGSRKGEILKNIVSPPYPKCEDLVLVELSSPPVITDILT